MVWSDFAADSQMTSWMQQLAPEGVTQENLSWAPVATFVIEACRRLQPSEGKGSSCSSYAEILGINQGTLSKACNKGTGITPYVIQMILTKLGGEDRDPLDQLREVLKMAAPLPRRSQLIMPPRGATPEKEEPLTFGVDYRNSEREPERGPPPERTEEENLAMYLGATGFHSEDEKVQNMQDYWVSPKKETEDGKKTRASWRKAIENQRKIEAKREKEEPIEERPKNATEEVKVKQEPEDAINNKLEAFKKKLKSEIRDSSISSTAR